MTHFKEGQAVRVLHDNLNGAVLVGGRCTVARYTNLRWRGPGYLLRGVQRKDGTSYPYIVFFPEYCVADAYQGKYTSFNGVIERADARKAGRARKAERDSYEAATRRDAVGTVPDAF